MSSALTNGADALVMGIRSALFIPVAANRQSATWSQLMLLTILSLLIQFLSDLSGAGWGGEFVAEGLPAALFGLPIMLFAAWMIAAGFGQAEKTLLLAVAYSATSLPIDIIYHLINGIAAENAWPALYRQLITLYGYYLAVFWYVLAVSLLALRLLALRKKQWPAVLMLHVILIGLPLALVYREPTLWAKPHDPSAGSPEQQAVVSETILYQQPALLQKQLDSLKAGQRHRTDLYFVGVAGYAGQDVFMKEVQSVASLFNERFGTQERSLVLINNPKTAASLPLASVTSMGRSLQHLGKLMNREEDILFLFLTSHGSKDHRFELEYGGVQFNELNPVVLRKLLDASGIRHRVIIVSACYSGGFVDALKDPHSLIITAAAHDRNSFGCSNENDFTYFGRAYFDEALRKTKDFVEAFDMAKPVIQEREQQEGYLPSNPQIFIGEKITPALEKLSRQSVLQKTK